MYDFETVDDVVHWFTEGRRNDLYVEADLRRLIENMISMNDPFDHGWNGERKPTLYQAWNWIIQNSLLVNGGNSCWITREGKTLGAAYSWHDKLIYWMGLEVNDVECAGWARMGPMMWQCKRRLSPQQKRIIKGAGHIIDSGKERLKPVWTPVEGCPATNSPFAAIVRR